MDSDEVVASSYPPQKKRKVSLKLERNSTYEDGVSQGLQDTPAANSRSPRNELPDYVDSDYDTASEPEVNRHDDEQENEDEVDSSGIPDSFRPLLESLKSRQKDLVASLRDVLSDMQERRQLRSMEDLSITLSGEKQNKTIAIIGESGKGKSSLVNALLNTTVAPTSMGNSCTTVPTHFTYAPSGDTEYRAVIEYMSQQEAEAEAMEWVSHIKAQLSMTNVAVKDGTEAAEDTQDSLEEEANIAKDCMRALGYSGGFEKDTDLNPFIAYTIDLYKSNQTLQSLEAHKLLISADDEETFTERIRDFLKHDSVISDHQVQLWPLLKSVQIYLDSPLLKNGITIIDLPGYNDQNAARSTLAQRFISRSDVDEVIIVAAYERIFSNALLLPVLNMGIQNQAEFEGGKRLIIACTKVDQLMSLPENELQIELCNVPNFREQLDMLKRQKIKARRTRGRVADIDIEIQKLEAENVEKLPSIIEENFHKQLKEHSKNVSNHQITFKVFMTSARDYLKERDKESENARKTGIPSLMGFLSKIAIEKHAISFKELLNEFQRQVLILQCSLANSEMWFSEETRLVFKTGIDLAIDELSTRINDGLRNTREQLEKHIYEFEEFLRNTISETGEDAVEAHRNCLKTNATQFNTYQCICAKKGDKFQSRGLSGKRIYELNKLFTSIVSEKVKGQWKSLWNDLKSCISVHEKSATDGLDDFLAAVLKIFKVGGVDTAAIELLVGSAINSISNSALKSNKKIRSSRKKGTEIICSEGEIKKSLKPIYEKAANYNGPNKFHRKKEIIEHGLLRTSAFDNIEATIIFEVHQVGDKCYKLLKKTAKRVLKDIENMTTALYDRSHKNITSGKEQRDIAKGLLAEAYEACRADEEAISKFIATLGTI